MCSAACKIATNVSMREVCYGIEEDENKATAEDLAIHALTAFSLSSELAANPACSIPPLGRGTNADSSIETYVRDQLRRSIKKNFEGREYITRPKLLQVLSEGVVRCLVQQHMSERTQSGLPREFPMGCREDMVSYIVKEARVLLALCIFVDAPMRTFLKLLEAGIHDRGLPLTGECPSYDGNDNFARIYDNQWTFLPFDLFARPGQASVPEEYIIPLVFDSNKDFIGCGAYSDVFRVTMDGGPCSSAHREKGRIYALKRFKEENPSVERSFGREYSVLQELSKVPHDHILLHLAAWSQAGVFYIIFPEARCNLRSFMDEVDCPGLAAGSVVWFFKQLRGLADAVRHMHALQPLPELYQFRNEKPVAETDQAAFHNDIKPENILVFSSDDGSPGVLKISDFGCGKVFRKDRNSGEQATESFYGTRDYESPDLVIYNEASKPNDIWALGCVFLELLDWFMIPRSRKQMTFQSQRLTGPGSTDATFWWCNADNKYQLKPQVGQKLMELENKYCLEKRAFELLLHMIWFLLATDMKERWPAERVYNDMNHITRQTIVDLGQDPDYYLRPRTEPQTIPLLLNARPEVSWLVDSDSEDTWREEEGWYLASRYYDWNTTYAKITDFDGNEYHLGNRETGQSIDVANAALRAAREKAPPLRKKRDFWDRRFARYPEVFNIKAS